MTTYEKLLKANGAEEYPHVVSMLIHERYSADDETALINNYIADPETYRGEYAEYQAFRAQCKQTAREMCGLLDEEES